MFVEYRLSDGLVVNTSESPEVPAEGNAIALSGAHDVGDELLYDIFIQETGRDDGAEYDYVVSEVAYRK